MYELQGTKNTNVCVNFDNECKRLNYSQIYIGKFLDVSPKTIARWQSKIAIPSDQLGKLTELGVDPAYVITGMRSVIHETALIGCIAIFEDVLCEIGKVINPVHKAKVIAVMYEDFIVDEESVNRESVLRLIRLVS